MSTAVATPAHTRSSRFRNFVVTAAAKTVESIKQLSPQRMRGVMKRADRAKATIKLSVPFQQELAGTGSGDGETSPSVASSTDATVKASPRHSQVRVTTGSQIYLVKSDCVVTVVGMDVIGQRYLLRNEDTKYEWYETLTGSGRVTWNTVASKPTPLPLQGESSCSACEEPPPPKEAPAPRMTRKGQRKAVRAAELAAEEFQCPICCYDLDDTSAPHRGEWGNTSCCDRAVCKDCMSRWRRSNTGKFKFSKNNPEDRQPDTRRCPFCNTLNANCASMRRIFGDSHADVM